MNTTLTLLFISMTNAFNLPAGMLSAVCFTESSHHTKALNPHDGGSASIGVCQVKYNTAKMLGYTGTPEQLQVPEINVYYAAMLLRRNLDRYDNNWYKAISAYNAGSYRENIHGEAPNRKYVKKVLAYWGEGR